MLGHPNNIWSSQLPPVRRLPLAKEEIMFCRQIRGSIPALEPDGHFCLIVAPLALAQKT